MELSTKFSAVSSILALAGFLGVAGPAQADQVNGDYLTFQGGTIQTNLGGGGAGRFTFDRDALLSGIEFQGILVTNGGPSSQQDLGGNDDLFYAFCLEPTEFLIDPHIYDVKELTDAPITGVSGAMSDQQAQDLRILFGNVYPDFSQAISTENAIALQIAVWEIANESFGVYDVTGGDPTAGVIWTTSDNGGARGIAQGWLDNINDDSWTTEAAGLIALTDTAPGKAQDYVVQQVVPIPAAAWLFGSALFGTVALGRRKQKKAVA